MSTDNSNDLAMRSLLEVRPPARYTDMHWSPDRHTGRHPFRASVWQYHVDEWCDSVATRLTEATSGVQGLRRKHGTGRQLVEGEYQGESVYKQADIDEARRVADNLRGLAEHLIGVADHFDSDLGFKPEPTERNQE